MFGYILGSIPFGVIFSNILGNGKLRETGSKNIGATNAFRTQGKIVGILTLVMDFLKGFVPYYFLETENEILNSFILAAPVIGHMFPIWLKFKGGKGIATYLGCLCALSPIVGFYTIITWIMMFLILKISAAAGLISVVTSLLIFDYARTALCWDFINQLYALIGLVVLIFVKHSENINRLIRRGQEV
jgi:glycerol-3-phosphate acyltransferase PlsY